MSTLPRYSCYLKTLFDMQEPFGLAAGSTHVSVLQGALPYSADHVNFGVIWDEDHDIRVAHLAEKMLLSGLMESVLFVGESKGIFSVIVDPIRWAKLGPEGQFKFAKEVEELADSNPYDAWASDVSVWSENDNYAGARLDLLRCIRSCWSLGPHITAY